MLARLGKDGLVVTVILLLLLVLLGLSGWLVFNYYIISVPHAKTAQTSPINVVAISNITQSESQTTQTTTISQRPHFTHVAIPSNQAWETIKQLDAYQEKLKTQLFEKKYEELELFLESLYQAVIDRPEQEFELFFAYSTFEQVDDSMMVAIEHWAETRPSAYQAQLALGTNYIKMGWKIRGSGYSRSVKPEDMRTFTLWQKKALLPLHAALKQRPQHPIVWSQIINAECIVSGAKCIEKLAPAIEQQIPNGYFAHSVLLNYMQPKWFGSTRMIRDYLRRTIQPKLGQAPYLSGLLAAEYSEAKAKAYDDKNYEMVKYFAEKQLETGRSSDNLKTMYYACMRLEDTVQAKEIINELLTKHKFAATSIREIVAHYTNLYRYKGDELYREGKLSDAIKQYDQALEMSPADTRVLEWRSKAHLTLNHYAEAEADARVLMAVNPDYYEGFRQADYSLAYQKRWEDILLIWEDYLSRHPDDAKAYYERGGTYFQMHNYPASLQDVQKSCELGSEQACAWRDRLITHPSLQNSN